MPEPMTGDVLDRPIDPQVKRAFYTNVLNASRKIEVNPTVIPTQLSKKKPKGLGDDLMQAMQALNIFGGSGGVQKQTIGGGDLKSGAEDEQVDTRKALPSNLAWRG